MEGYAALKKANQRKEEKDEVPENYAQLTLRERMAIKKKMQ